MPRVIHFDIAVADLDQAAKFYENVFGWQIQKWEIDERTFLVTTGTEGSGIDGALFLRNQTHTGRVILTIDVDSVDAYLMKVNQAGGKLIVPKQTIPSVGSFAYCTDPEGNEFGVFEEPRG